MSTRRKPADRANATQFNVRVPDEFREGFAGLVGEMRAVQRAGGGPLTRTDLVRYWLVWMMRLKAADRAAWARQYREAYRAHLDELDLPGSGKADGQSSGARALPGKTFKAKPERDLAGEAQPALEPRRPKRIS